MTYPKRLIEVDLPIKRISEHARREKSIRHGHISTLHIWWARRPLAACRAVICAALWPDPADPLCPQNFRDKAAEIITDFARQAASNNELAGSCAPDTWQKWLSLAKPENQLDPMNEAHLNVLRFALLDFIADFANWDNSTNAAYLATSRALTQAAHEALGGEAGTRPLVVDPFAGGGAIPLEALRVGADTFASDLNPVAVLLNKVVLEYIPKYGQQLADEVRKWGAWIKQEAENELAEFYPKDPDGATPIAYLWARTIQCEGPGCGAKVPLMRSFWLSKKGTRLAALQFTPNRENRCVDVKIIVKQSDGWVDQDNHSKIYSNPRFDGTVKRGAVTCPCCNYTTPAQNVRGQVKHMQGGADTATLLAVYIQGTEGRKFRLVTEGDLFHVHNARNRLIAIKDDSAINASFSLIPDEELPYLRSIFNVQLIGVTEWGLLFSKRQQLGLSILVNRIRKLNSELVQHEYESEFAKAIQESLALVFGKVADRYNAFARWEPNVQCPQQLYGRQALGIVWDFGEIPPIRDCAGSWSSLLDVWLSGLPNITQAKLKDQSSGRASVAQVDAASHSLPDDGCNLFLTDPPYYDAIPYADLSDFFYVWLKRILKELEPDLFANDLTPKLEEIVQLSERNPKYAAKTKENFEKRMQYALAEGRRITIPQGIAVIVFAHKATAAWETMLQAVIDAGWTIVGSWPIDTEMETRLRALNSATLSSSVHLVCRPRENADGSLQADNIGDYRDVLHELPLRIREWMPRLASEGVVGADAIFACLGPALEIFSRYARVEKVTGEQVLLREYLEQVWAAVSREALNMIFTGADATGFDADARLTAIWFWTLSTGNGATADNATAQADLQEDSDEDEESTDKTKKPTGYTLEFDAARKIAQGLGAHLEDLNSVIEIKGDKARLLSVAERAQHLFGKQELDAAPARKKKTPQAELFDLQSLPGEDGSSIAVKIQAGGTVLDRIHQAMLLFSAGRSEALKRFLVEDGIGRDQRFWRLADALSKLYPMSSDEKRWVDGVLARKKGLGF